MSHTRTTAILVGGCIGLLTACAALAADWPQWRGPNRDGKIEGYNAPSSWPKELTPQWKVNVGAGDATPALVGNRLYVFSQQGNNEDTICLDANTGKEIWHDKYSPHVMVSGPAGRHPGPRSSPAVAGGKVVTLGYAGTLSCLDAETGKVVWRKEFKDEFPKTEPKFWIGTSPLIAEGMAIAHLGSEATGALVACDMNNGDIKWQWTGDGPSYSSPVVMEAGGVKQVIDESDKFIVGISLADGKLLWQMPYQGRGMGGYNVATPIVEGDVIYCSGGGRGCRALRVEKQGEGFAARESWSNPDGSTQFSSPVLVDQMLFGLSDKGNLFCINAKDGKTLWTQKTGRNNFGSLLNAGSEVMMLVPDGTLTIFKPSGKQFEQVAQIKLEGSDFYAHPIVSDDGIYVKDKATLTKYITGKRPAA